MCLCYFFILFFARMVFSNSSVRDTASGGGPCVRSLGLVEGETPPSEAPSGGSLSGCGFSLTSLGSSSLSAENSALMGILLILKGLNVNCQPMRTSITGSHYRSSSPVAASNPNQKFNGTPRPANPAEKISRSGRSFPLNCERGGIDQQ